MNEVLKRIGALRKAMADLKIDWYFMTSDDYHSSEYVSDYFKVREHFSGFTGDNAYLLLDKDSAYMWTDGRYFIQAEGELKGTTINLMRMGEEGVPTVTEFIKANVKKGMTLAFDGRCVSTSLGKKIKKILEANKAKLNYEDDTAAKLWKDRPSLPDAPLYILKDETTGESCTSKLKRVRKVLKDSDAGALLLSKLDDIAWLTNMRGNDIECNPVFLSYMIVTEKEAYLFLRKCVVTKKIKTYLDSVGVTVIDYDDFFKFLSEFSCGKKLMLEENSVSFAAFMCAGKGSEILNMANPTTYMKAVKNKTELKHIREICVTDSVCMIKFMYWLKASIGKEKLSELDAAAKIDGLRSKVKGFIELSFPTIAGYGPNAAMMHYSATEKSFAYLKPENFLLVDSGGQYENGTTDVTRTFVLGPVTDEMKLHFSKVAAGMLALADARFLYGCTGRNVDILARLPLWELGIDYKCGTGHGIGYILNVHEGPHGIRWKYNPDVNEAVLEDGMLMSDEPGVYIEGSHGIRTENMLLSVKAEKTPDGQFMKFEQLTWIPIDREALDKKYLSEKDIKRINDYHKKVYQKTFRFLNENERKWLKEQTKPL